MALLKKFLFSRLVLYIVGMLIAAMLIWFLGPLLGFAGSEPLSGALQRALAICLMPAILGLSTTLMHLRNSKAVGEFADGVAKPSAEAQAAAASSEEVAALSTRLKEALDLLKKSSARRRWGSGWLYQLPWYMFIGPPGSGKTTALTNSGLNFPLAEQLGKHAVRGVGGTRSCDWWFTDDAVLIDTAGRYTTQDSEAAVDAGAWTGFLKLLKKFRKRQPINGAIVAIGLPDLLSASEAQRLEHAKAIRLRIKELYAELGVRFPIYVLFTKADLIAGFVEFFDDLGREEREQVWGMTFDAAKIDAEGGVIAAYPAEFDLLIGRLNDRLTERLQQEQDIQRRALIFGFPQQVASFKEITDNFLREVFQPNRYEERTRLRGIYFTSGTQDGTPIDRLMGAMAASFGISRQQVTAFSGSGRSYFLTRLMRNVIFGEAGLVSADAKLERRTRMIQYGVLGAAALGVLLMTAGWITTYLNNSGLIAAVNSAVDSYNEQAKAISLDRVTDSNLRPILPLLATLRNMPGGYAHREDSIPFTEGLGLYQGDKLGAQAIEVYHRTLGRTLLPRMLVRLEGQLVQNQNRPDFLYEALKVYLMLGRQGKLDKQLIRRWMALDWASQFPGPENEADLNALKGHLDAMLERPLPEIPLNAGLVEQTRGVLLRVPLAERVYNLIKTHPKVTALPEWRISEHAGPAVSRALVRPSGRSLSEGIPGLYTHDGYFKTFLPLLPDIAKEAAKESWVLGPQAQTPDDPVAIGRLQRDVTSLYLEDFAAQWDRLLADIAVAPFTSVGQATQLLNVLSAPDSPIRALLVSAANETWLSRPPKTPDTSTAGLAAAAAQAAEKAASKAAPKGVPDAGKSAAEQQLASVLGTPAGGVQDLAGPFTDKRFKALHDLVEGTGGAPPALDGVMGNLNDLYIAMTRLGASGDATKALAANAGDAGGGAAKLQADAARLPEPLKGMIGQLTKSSSTLTVGGARAQLNALWTAQVVPFCQSALENRYPAFKGQSNEVTLDDFSRLFSKGGLVDAFFTQNLRQFVDVSKNPWVWQKVDNLDLGIPPATLAQFQRAASIRDNMFPGGGTKAGVNFEIVPVSLDAKSTEVVVDVDGQTISYDHGPPRAVKMQWPGSTGHVRISFQPQVPGETTTIERDGVWAWFRVLQDSQLKESTGADRYIATFKVGDRSAAFEIRANSVINPFASNQLELFRCPPTL
jgi:type VI secretion system protein ImpL